MGLLELPGIWRDPYARGMEIRVLGPLEVVSDGAVVAIGGPKQRLVLALLIEADGYAVSSDSLIDRVWGDSPPGDVRSSIHTYISRLRGVFGDLLERVGDGYRLALDGEVVDARVFERLVGEARATIEADPETAGTHLREALALWRGHPYADLRDEPALRAELTRLQELRTAAIEARIEADLALGHDADLVGELEVLTAEYPFQERFRHQHMLALYRAGRQAEALRAYQRTRTTLGEELGVEPSPELQDLEDRILRQDPTLELDLAPRVDTRAILFTDLESSTVLWELHPIAMPSALAKHDEILTAAVEDAGGRVFKATGDGVCAEFAEVQAAITAAAMAQRDLVRFEWGETGPLRARIAVDVGEVETRAGDLFGPTINRCARIMAAGHGGQILLSNPAHRALLDSAEAGWEMRTLGEYRFKGMGRPHRVSQLVIDGLPAEFPPLQIDRLPPPLPGTAFGRTVRGYELREQIGGGDFGIVYRAYQPTVGREVAVKVIRPEYVDQPAFVRRFEVEAQLVAQLEHQHIVALYDYWRDPDGAYLVMRWLRGGSLRRALDRGPFNHATALTLLDQLGGALSYAHRQGVAHRDLKPGNVMLDDEGNAYLTDFGIATRLVDASDAGRPYATSPAYVPPEELRGEPLTLRADIYALGMLTFELFTGQPPPMDGPLPAAHEIRSDLPISLAGVIGRAVADDPADRFATVGEFLADLHAGFGEEPAEPISAFTPTRNPYKGLHPFREADSVDFHGRDTMVDQLLAALAEHPLVAVVGPSGIGKSSVVRAGLIPALRAGGLPGSRQWLITDMYPGSYPFEELAGALLKVAATTSAELAEDLQRDARGLLRASKQLVGADDTVLLVIDQFEELFTLTRDEGTRQLFLDALTTLLDDDRRRVKVVVTLRADFFDRPLRYPEFGALLKEGLVAVTALTDEELAAAIQAPAEGVGIKLEPGLTKHILADLYHQPGALPLLQYALTELFSSRHSDLLTIGGYDAAGGVTGALGSRAEQLYAGLGESGQEVCRQFFLRLVNVEEQTEDTRRRVRRRELQGLGSEDEIEPVLKLYGEHRLLSFDRDPVTRGPTVEVAHEALLSEWERLDGWITQQRESLILHGRFRAAVDEWEASGRTNDYLLGGGRLAQFETWAESSDLTLTADEREFLGGSREAADRDEARRRRVRRFIVSGFAVVAVVALVFAVFALIQQQRAEDNAAAAHARELAASAVGVLDEDPELSLLLSLAASEVAEPTFEAVNALHEAILGHRKLTSYDVDGWTGATLTANGDTIVTLSGEGVGRRVEGRDPTTGDVLWSEDLPHEGSWWGPANLSTMHPTADGSHVVFPTAALPVGIYRVEAATGEWVLSEIEWPCPISQVFANGYGLVDEGPMWLLADTPNSDGDCLEQTEAILEVSPGGTTTVLAQHEWGQVVGLSVSADGTRLAYEVEGETTVLDLATREPVRVLQGVGNRLNGDGSLVGFGQGRLWDTASGEYVLELHRIGEERDWAMFTADGSGVFADAMNWVAHLWDANSGEELLTVPLGRPNGSLGSSLDGKLLARGQRVHTVWDTTAVEEAGMVALPVSIYPSYNLDLVDGRGAVTQVSEGRVLTFDTTTGDITGEILEISGQDIALSPDGRFLAAQRGSFSSRTFGPVQIIDTATGETVVTMDGWCEATFDENGQLLGPGCRDFPERPYPVASDQIEFSPDGTRLAATASTGTLSVLMVWDASSGTIEHEAELEGWHNMAWSPSGDLLALAPRFQSPTKLIVLDPQNWTEVARIADPSMATSAQIRFTPDGRHLLHAGLHDSTITVYDTQTWNEEGTATIVLSGILKDLDISPAGSMVAAAGGGFVTVLELDGLVPVHRIPLEAGRVNVEFVDDSHLLFLADGPGYVLSLDVEELIQIGRSRLTRTLTTNECETYHIDPCPAGP